MHPEVTRISLWLSFTFYYLKMPIQLSNNTYSFWYYRCRSIGHSHDAITFNELYSSNSLTVLHWCQNDNKTTKRERWIHNGVAVAIPVRAVRNSLRKLIRLSTRNIWNWNWNALLIWPRGIRLLAWLLESTIQQGLKRWTYRQKDIACQIFSRVAIRLLQRGWWSLTVVSEPAIDISYDFYRRTSVAN